MSCQLSLSDIHKYHRSKHIFYLIDVLFRCSSDDQVNLKAYLDALPTGDHQHFYRQVTDGEADNFLLVHQTGDQKRLMAKYGNELCLLDATYKTTRYALPLFFVVVPTNTCYQVVGTFMISHETTDCIREAVEHLARWNPEWKPSFWMTDCCAAEINAVESIFPGMRTNTLSSNNFNILRLVK